MALAAPVVIVGWRTGDEPNAWNIVHHRRMAWLRDQLSEHLRSAGVPFRFELLLRNGPAPRSAEVLLEELATCETPSVVVACEWDLEPAQHGRLVALHRQGVARVLMLTTSDADQDLPAVGYHQAGAGAEAARHCITSGFLRLLYLTPFAAGWSAARAAGVIAAANEAGVAVCCPAPGGALDHPGYQALDAAARTAVLKRGLERGLTALGGHGAEASTAIIACNDRIALDLRAFLPDFPGGLMGFDDEPVAATANLTSVRPPLTELARRAGELVIRLAHGEAIPTRTALPWELVLRGSTRRQRPTTARQRPAEPPAVSATPASGSAIRQQATVALLYRGVLPETCAADLAYVQRLERIRLSFLATMARAGVGVVELSVDFTSTTPAQAVDKVLASGVRAVVVQELEQGAPVAPLFAAAQAAGRIQVLFCDTIGVPVDQLGIIHDQGAAGSMAATHCLRQGYRRLLFLNPFTGTWCRDRALSARRALLLSSCGQTVLLIAVDQPTLEVSVYGRMPAAQREALLAPLLDDGLARLAAMPAEASTPAVLVANDQLGLDLLSLLRRRGLRPGIDLGVIGFDDLPESEEAGLTSVCPPLESMGSETARLAMRMLRGEQVSKRTCMPWTLVPRMSSRRG